MVGLEAVGTAGQRLVRLEAGARIGREIVRASGSEAAALLPKDASFRAAHLRTRADMQLWKNPQERGRGSSRGW